MMTFQIDRKMHSHPKVLAARLEAIGLWCLAGSHCADYGLEGFVSLEAAERFAGGRAAAKRAAARLVAAGLWVAVEGGWRFHDWADHQASPAAALERLERPSRPAPAPDLSEKRREAGRLGAMRRWQTDGKPDGKVAIADGNSRSLSPDFAKEETSKTEREIAREDGKPELAKAALLANGDGAKFPIPEDFPLTDEARAAAAMIGVRDIDDEWIKFRALHIQKKDVADARGWYVGAWPKFCVDAKRYQATARTRELARASKGEGDAERPYHDEAPLPKREKPLTSEQLREVLAKARAVFEPAPAAVST